MKSKLVFFLLVVTIGLSIAACGVSGSGVDETDIKIEDRSTPLNLADSVDVHTVAQVKDRSDVFLLDVREQWEYDEGHIPGVTLIPMGEIPSRLEEVPRDKQVIVTCRSGNRSGQVANFLRQNGFDNIHNMSGGIVDWESAGYEVSR
jgi:rhodanese-related sulfurtransferase